MVHSQPETSYIPQYEMSCTFQFPTENSKTPHLRVLGLILHLSELEDDSAAALESDVDLSPAPIILTAVESRFEQVTGFLSSAQL